MIYWTGHIGLISSKYIVSCIVCQNNVNVLLGGSSRTKEGLPESCQIACSSAISVLEQFSRQLQEGDITVLDLEKVGKKLGQMSRLCDAAMKEGVESPLNTMRSHVQLRLAEYALYLQQHRNLNHLCQMIDHSISGKEL